MKRQHVVLLGAVIASVGFIILLRQLGVVDLFQPQQIKVTILSYGIWAPFAYMGLYVLASVLFIPGSPLTLAGGAIFGPVYGTLYTIVGATAGAFVAFTLSRYFKKHFVHVGQGKVATTLASYDARITSHGFVTVLFLRFVPLFPFNGLNFALGLTKVTLRDYFFGTLFGIIPGTFAYVYFGDSLVSRNGSKIIVSILFIGILSYIGKKAVHVYKS